MRRLIAAASLALLAVPAMATGAGALVPLVDAGDGGDGGPYLCLHSELLLGEDPICIEYLLPGARAGVTG